MSGLASIQVAIVDLFNPNAQSPLDYIVSAISMLGSWQFLMALGIAIFLERRPLGKKLLLVLAITMLIIYPLKILTNDPRPCAAHENIRAVEGCESSGSFPSAHAALTFAYFVILSGEFKGRKKPFFAAAAAISVSRLYLGQHYPLDIIAGALIGYSAGYAVNKFAKV